MNANIVIGVAKKLHIRSNTLQSVLNCKVGKNKELSKQDIRGFSKQIFREPDKDAANEQANNVAPVFPRDNK